MMVSKCLECRHSFEIKEKKIMKGNGILKKNATHFGVKLKMKL